MQPLRPRGKASPGSALHKPASAPELWKDEGRQEQNPVHGQVPSPCSAARCLGCCGPRESVWELPWKRELAPHARAGVAERGMLGGGETGRAEPIPFLPPWLQWVDRKPVQGARPERGVARQNRGQLPLSRPRGGLLPSSPHNAGPRLTALPKSRLLIAGLCQVPACCVA